MKLLAFLWLAAACAGPATLSDLARVFDDPAATSVKKIAALDRFPPKVSRPEFHDLIVMLNHGDLRVVAAAARTLGRSLTAAPEDEGVLRQMANHRLPVVRAEGLAAVERLWSPENRAAVLERLKPDLPPAPAASGEKAALGLAECLRDHPDETVRAVTCRAVAAKSPAACAALAGLNFHDASNAALTPEELCRQRSLTPILFAAFVAHDPSVCPALTESFQNVKPSRRVKVCEALFSDGTPEQVCSAALAASDGAVVSAYVAATCRGDQLLRAMTGEDSCAAPGLPESVRENCLATFRWKAACAAAAERLSALGCALAQ